jgi:hypothetical protein
MAACQLELETQQLQLARGKLRRHRHVTAKTAPWRRSDKVQNIKNAPDGSRADVHSRRTKQPVEP